MKLPGFWDPFMVKLLVFTALGTIALCAAIGLMMRPLDDAIANVFEHRAKQKATACAHLADLRTSHSDSVFYVERCEMP